MRWSGVLLVAVFCLIALHCSAAQSKFDDDVFTLTVAAPTQAKDVQVRYVLTSDFGSRGSSVATTTDDNKILIQPAIGDKPAKAFKLIAYAPGCQFVTISIDDLATSGRQGTFQCTRLSTVQFHGHTNVSGISRKVLDVQVLYGCDWASRFFAGKDTSISPFSLGRAEIASDGSFTIDLPDFSADPSWSSFSSDARLMFYAVDSRTGQPVAELKSVDAQFGKGAVKVAAGYPEVEFTVTER